MGTFTVTGVIAVKGPFNLSCPLTQADNFLLIAPYPLHIFSRGLPNVASVSAPLSWHAFGHRDLSWCWFRVAWSHRIFNIKGTTKKTAPEVSEKEPKGEYEVLANNEDGVEGELWRRYNRCILRVLTKVSLKFSINWYELLFPEWNGWWTRFSWRKDQ